MDSRTILHVHPNRHIAWAGGFLMRGQFYLVVWWMSQVRYAAVFESRVAAEAAASVRNALMIGVSGEGAQVDSVVDWYRRNDAGQPMPAEWRHILGQVRVPASAKAPHSEEPEELPDLISARATLAPQRPSTRHA